MLARIAVFILLGLGSTAVIHAGMIDLPGDPDGALDGISCDMLTLHIIHLSDIPTFGILAGLIGDLETCFVNDSGTKWVNGRIDTLFPGGNLSDFHCHTTAFDFCVVQLNANNHLSITYSGTSNSPGIPGGGEALLTLIGWAPNEPFSGSFNDGLNPVPEPAPQQTFLLGIGLFLGYGIFNSLWMRTRQPESYIRGRLADS